MDCFDLHCDTLNRCLEVGEELACNTGQLDLRRGIRPDGIWVQVFAGWIDAGIRGPAAMERFRQQRQVLVRALEQCPEQIGLFAPGVPLRPGVCTAILAVEGGQVLGGRLENIPLLASLGVKFFTLTWNGENELGFGGASAGETPYVPGGLTAFGKACIPELERCGILVDISHLSDAGVEDVLSRSTRPVVATHSLLRSIHPHSRNLTEAQFSELVRRNGLCGLNFYPAFVNGETDYPPEALRRHLERMLELGGEDAVALGSDFDGAAMPSFLSGVEGLYTLFGFVVKWVGEAVARKLFYENAAAFAARNLR